MTVRIYFDTNTLIWAVEEVSHRSDLLNSILAASRQYKSPVIVTSELALAELLVLPLREGRGDFVRRYDDLIRPTPWMAVAPVDRMVLWRAGALRAAGRIKLPDAIHLATAQLSMCTHFLSADAGFASYVRSHTGDEWALSMIRPDIPTLTTLLDTLSP